MRAQRLVARRKCLSLPPLTCPSSRCSTPLVAAARPSARFAADGVRAGVVATDPVPNGACPFAPAMGDSGSRSRGGVRSRDVARSRRYLSASASALYRSASASASSARRFCTSSSALHSATAACNAAASAAGALAFALARPSSSWLHLLANTSVDCVSGKLAGSGARCASMRTREFPPNESASRRVSREFRNGTCARFSSRALTTSPSADRLLLMCCASRRRSPRASDRATRSDPARSTRCSLPFDARPDARSVPTHRTVTTQWLRLERSLSAVAELARRAIPSDMIARTCAASLASTRATSSSASEASEAPVVVPGPPGRAEAPPECKFLDPLEPPFQLASSLAGRRRSRTCSL